MIDAGCARLDSPSRRDIDRREQTKLDCRRHEKSGHDRSEGRVFRHVFRISLVIAIVAVLFRVLMVVVSNDFDAVVMNLKSPEHLMRMTHHEKQRHEEQEKSALAKTGHQQNQR